MDNNLLDKLKKEGISLIALFIISIILFKILYYNEKFIIILRIISSFFWIFILPGFCLMYHWHERIGFSERLIIGIALSAAIIGIVSYYLGLIGLHIKYHGIVLPIVIIIVSGVILLRPRKQA